MLIFNIYKQHIQFNIKRRQLFKKWTEELNIHFQRGNENGQQTWKKGSTPIIIREMQVKTTMRSHLMPARITIFKMNTNNKC